MGDCKRKDLHQTAQQRLRPLFRSHLLRCRRHRQAKIQSHDSGVACVPFRPAPVPSRPARVPGPTPEQPSQPSIQQPPVNVLNSSHFSIRRDGQKTNGKRRRLFLQKALFHYYRLVRFAIRVVGPAVPFQTWFRASPIVRKRSLSRPNPPHATAANDTWQWPTGATEGLFVRGHFPDKSKTISNRKNMICSCV
jgi:hypothetical protein